MKITSAPGPDHRIFKLNRLECLKIDLKWTRNGPGLDLDLDLSLTIKPMFFQGPFHIANFSGLQIN